MSELENRQDAPEQQLQQGQAEGATQEGTEATEQQPVNLDELPEFRQWKSKMDRKLAAEKAERDRLAQELDQFRSKVDELSLRDASPDEREQYYKNKIATLEEERRMQAARQRKVAEATQRAEKFVTQLGLSMDTPGLDFSGDPTTTEGWQQFALSAAEIASKQRNKTQEQIDAEVREAQQEAVKKTGAAKVSTATGQASPLRAEYQKKLEALRGSGNFRAYSDLKAEYRKKGLKI